MILGDSFLSWIIHKLLENSFLTMIGAEIGSEVGVADVGPEGEGIGLAITIGG